MTKLSESDENHAAHGGIVDDDPAISSVLSKMPYMEPDGVHVGKIGADGRTHTLLDIPQSAVSHLSLHHGKKLKLIRSKSGALVTLRTNFKGKGPAKLNISGNSDAVSVAISLVKAVIASI